MSVIFWYVYVHNCLYIICLIFLSLHPTYSLLKVAASSSFSNELVMIQINTRDQYRAEMEQRYLKYVQKEDEREELSRKALVRQEKKQREKNSAMTKKFGTRALAESATTFGRYIPSALRVSTIVLDSAFRDNNLFPQANDFVVKIPETLRDVGAIRLLRTEFYQPSNTMGYFVMNEVRVPLQLYNIESSYLYLNGYQNMQVGHDTQQTFFARMGPGTEMYPAVTGDIRQDPLMYMFLPAEPRLRRFHVKLLQADGSLYEVNNARVVLTLAVYCLAPGLPGSV